MDDNQKKIIEEKFRENTGKLIKETRKKKGWKQAYLAEKVGVSSSVMSDIENGKEDMPLSRLAVISHVNQFRGKQRTKRSTIGSI